MKKWALFFESHYKVGRVDLRTLVFLALLAAVFKVTPLERVPWLDHRSNQAFAAADQSDLNGDDVVDLHDLGIFSRKWLQLDWQEVDWCQWIIDNAKREKQFNDLFAFIREYFQCGQPPEPNEPPPPADDLLKIKNINRYPTRLAYGPQGKLFVSDAVTGSVFIYDPGLTATGELKGLNKPLGLAVDSQGNIYVGNNGFDNVEVYDSKGVKIATFGEGIIRMPNDLAFDREGNLYVVDSLSNTVRVYDSNHSAVRNIGTGGDAAGQLRSPIALTIAYRDNGSGQEVGELYVADMGHSLVQVFGLQGNFLRSFGGVVSQGMMGWKWQGKFVKLQSLAVDQYGRLHAADCFVNRVQILNPLSGDYIDSYGTWGTGPGQLNLPLDIAIDNYGNVAVTNNGNKRVEIIYTVP